MTMLRALRAEGQQDLVSKVTMIFTGERFFNVKFLGLVRVSHSFQVYLLESYLFGLKLVALEF